MGRVESLSHSRWECKYHVVFIPKYRKKAIFGQIRSELGGVFRRLAEQRESTIEEGHLMPDHVHMMISIPPKYAVAQVIGFIKGKSAIHIARTYAGRLRRHMRHEELTLFPLIDRVRSYPTVDGQQAAEISLDKVAVDGASVVGEAGAGFAALDATIDEATLAVCAEAVGIMQIMTDKTVQYSKDRMQFGVPIGSFQALQHRMVDMFTDCEQSYSLLLWATMLAAQDDAGAKRAISSIKYQVGTVGRKVGQEAVQIHGGMGVSWEVDIAHYFKRLTAIDQIFGNADWHLDRLAG